MTDLPKEDRDLIERVLGKDEVRWLARIGCNTFSVEMVAKLLAAARSEGPARAPVVDEGVLSRMRELATNERCHWGATAEPAVDVRVSDLKALLAALGASQ